MSAPRWREEPIGKAFDRSGFDCGEAALDDYLRRHARQNHDSGVSKTILAVAEGDGRTILGYFTLSPASVAYAKVPDVARRSSGRYDVPGFRLGRLAVARSMQGRGLGGQLLLAAARRCILASSGIGGTALFIDAKDERAAGWYAGHGAAPLLDAPLTLVLPLATAAAALKAAGRL